MNYLLGPLTVNQLEHFELCWDNTDLTTLTTLNAEILLTSYKDERFCQAVSGKGAKISVDGQWIMFALNRKYGKLNIAKNSGSDLIYSVAEQCHSDGKKLLLLGGAIDTNNSAVKKLREHVGGNESIFGYSPPFSKYPFSLEFSGAIEEKVRQIRPHVIITAFGVPKQEYWSLENGGLLEECGVRYVLFFGGAIDMVAGKYKRAPGILTKLGLEGIYRLILQPSRIRRYYKLLKLIPMIVFNRL
ncbi:WecB/TagA/CpsF family glycosyltransferase [Agaribacterium sp. ZY112]|uniref:WecB/TagA/CpsF family glycosyltransferase n=1 Tax=Agaribacterium sp. ZY112 TaxID=3233574 RepID=UPI003526079B